MILEVLAIAAGVAAGGAVGVWLRRRRRAAPSSKAKEGEVRSSPRAEGDLRVGDAVLQLGEDYLVAGESRFEEEAVVFTVWTLEAGARVRFVLRDAGPPRTTCWLSSVDPPVRGRPSERVRHGEVELRLRRRGRARVSGGGGGGPIPDGEVEYSRYRGPGRSAALVLVTREQTLWLMGEEVLPGMLEILPGS